MKQFRETGCVKVKKHMRQPSVVTPEKVDEVQDRMEASPKKYLRLLAQQAHCSYFSARKTVKTLKLYPYKIHGVHQLLEPDKEKRIADCEWFQRMVREQDNGLDVIFFF